MADELLSGEADNAARLTFGWRLWRSRLGLRLRPGGAAGEKQDRGEEEFTVHGLTMPMASRGRKVAAD
jgi:hypothetical protein